jgi:hypothetical protein
MLTKATFPLMPSSRIQNAQNSCTFSVRMKPCSSMVVPLKSIGMDLVMPENFLGVLA